MSYGLQIFASNGSITLDISNRAAQYIGSTTFNMSVGNLKSNYSVPFDLLPSGESLSSGRYFLYSPTHGYLRLTPYSMISFTATRPFAALAITATAYVFRA